MITQSLAGGHWTVASTEHGPHEAMVPGCVHDALMHAGAIPDPDSPGGEAAQAFIGRTDWRWCTRFEVDAEHLEQERIELVLDSVDTIGSLWLNGSPIGKVASQFVPARFDLRGVLFAGVNYLVVVLKGTLAEAERAEAEFGSRPINADGAWGPFSQLRKSACNFGWDWGPCCPTCGFAGDVRIESWSGSRIAAIRPQVLSATSELVRMRVLVDVDGPASCSAITVRTDDGRTLVTGKGAATSEALEITDPPLWWPRGLGSQELVTIEVELDDGTRESCRTGLRTTELESGADGRFAVRVNGEPVFCRGANWIPSKLFPHGQTSADIDPLLEQACAANMNMLRVWGGGLYEPSWFYERCDELGLMVWQDFMFACATYPEHDAMVDLVRAEARAQVARLARHPSIVLWCGGNEDVLAWFSWGWREQMEPEQRWGARYWTELLPSICAELDPSRPYWAESPWSGSLERHPNDPETGDRHTWDLKLEGYRDLVPRFASEFGHQGPPTLRSIEEAFGVPGEALTPETLVERQRAWGGDEVQYAPYLESWFGITPDAPVSFGSWHWAAQLLQARAMSIACTWLRANGPRCEGALIWQLNDVWTGHSWSLLDVKHRPKPVFHAVQSAFDPVLLAIEPLGEGLSLVLVNASQEAVDGEVVVRRVDFDGTEIAAQTFGLSVDPRRGLRAIELPKELVDADCPSRQLIVASFGDRTAHWFFAKDRLLEYPEARCKVTMHRVSPTTARVEVEAASLMRDLCLSADRLGVRASAEKGLLTLLPGESTSILVSNLDSSEELPLDGPHESNRSFIRTANELVHPPVEPG